MPNTPSRTRWCARWGRWACSVCRSMRNTAGWEGTTSRCRWHSRNWARWTSRWPSPSKPVWASAPCRSTGSVPKSRSRSGCRTWLPAARWQDSGSPSQARARMRVPPPPRPNRTATSGSSTGPNNSSPTPAPTSPRWSPSRPSPERGHRGRTGRPARRSRRSSCPVAQRVSPPSPRTTRWGGTRRTPTRSVSVTRGCPRRICSVNAAAATPTSCPSSTRDESRSRRWRPGWRRAAWTRV